MKTTIRLFLAFLCLSVAGPKVKAVSPPPDGGYPGGNTAEGQAALLSLTSGGFNTGVGFLALRSNTTNSFNTAVGAGALLANTADQNTATGAGVLLSNTAGLANTANGAFALFSNTGGQRNTATGIQALFSNTTANFNTANGDLALFSNTTGNGNTAVGDGALLNNTTGSGNIALGGAGTNVTTASNVACIGAVGANVDNSCYISRIHGATSSNGIAVFIDADGKLGTTTSSLRFKGQIKPMDQASEELYALRPVRFRYKKEIDPARTSQFGLVAEEVEQVNPDLIVRDKEGRPYSVRYDQVNAMLLNEFLKEHRKVQEQAATIGELKLTVARQQAEIAQQEKSFQSRLVEQDKQIEALASGLERVSAQLAVASPSRGGLEMSKAAPNVALNNP